MLLPWWSMSLKFMAVKFCPLLRTTLAVFHGRKNFQLENCDCLVSLMSLDAVERSFYFSALHGVECRERQLRLIRQEKSVPLLLGRKTQLSVLYYRHFCSWCRRWLGLKNLKRRLPPSTKRASYTYTHTRRRRRQLKLLELSCWDSCR